MRNLSIVYDDVRMRRKSEDNIFAFISVRDQSSIRQLLKGGIIVQGKKLRVFNQEKKSDSRDSRYWLKEK